MNTYHSPKNVISKDSEGKPGKYNIFDKGRCGLLGLKCENRRFTGNSGKAAHTWQVQFGEAPGRGLAVSACAQGCVCLSQPLRT